LIFSVASFGEEISTLSNLKKLEVTVSCNFALLNSLKQLRKLKLLCSRNCNIISLQQISLPQLRTLILKEIDITYEDIELIFHAFSATLNRLVINKVKITSYGIPNTYFTALEIFEIKEIEQDNFYDRILELIGGSAETLKKLEFIDLPRCEFNISQFKNLEYLHCSGFDKNVNLLKLIKIIG
jgi:hypothetical protein